MRPLMFLLLFAAVAGCDRSGSINAGGVRISEVLPDARRFTAPGWAGAWDAIELYNPSPRELKLGGYYLSDSGGNLRKWAFPQGTVISGKGFLVVAAGGDDQESLAGNDRPLRKGPFPEIAAAVAEVVPAEFELPGRGIVELDRIPGAGPAGRREAPRIGKHLADPHAARIDAPRPIAARDRGEQKQKHQRAHREAPRPPNLDCTTAPAADAAPR